MYDSLIHLHILMRQYYFRLIKKNIKAAITLETNDLFRDAYLQLHFASLFLPLKYYAI